MSTLTENRSSSRPTRASGLRLVAGDHLDVGEFRRRYEASPEIKKAELLNGIVYMPPPVFEDHSTPHNIAATWIGFYSVHTRGTKAHNDRTLQLVGYNQVQPDVCLVLLPECGGKTFVNEHRELAGFPELIFEVAASSASYDLFEKKNAYHANQVQEYIVWQTLDHRLDWFQWTPAEYVRRAPDARGMIKSNVFPGLWLHATALLLEEYQKVMKTLEHGLRTAEHSRFVTQLSAKLKRRH
jgi:Uma2 family endonuclease